MKTPGRDSNHDQDNAHMDEKPRNNIDDYGPQCSKMDEWHERAYSNFVVLTILAFQLTWLIPKVCTIERRKINTKIET